MSARVRKIVGDLAAHPVRGALAVLAMTAGAFGAGMILTAFAILTRELKATYENTRPASMIVTARDDLAAAVRGVPGVADVEERAAIRARMRLPDGDWRSMALFAVDGNRIDRIETGAADLAALRDDEVLIEQASLSVTRARVGDRIAVKLADGTERSLRIAGTVHAAGLAPGWMDHHVAAFVRGGFASDAARLLVVVDGDRTSVAHIRDVAARVRGALEARGAEVTSIDIPPPGRHPHADQMATFLFLLGAFGALTLALSAVLVATMIHALVAEQVRQVGVMKALGATTGQIAALYLAQVALLATTAAAIGIPLGYFAGRAYAAFCATILNATIGSSAIPAWTIAVQLATALLVPLAVAAGPVVRASRISIPEAFSNGIGRRPFGTRAFDRALARIGGLPRPLMLSLRTAFHQRGRLLLTVATLAAGGAVFLTTLNAAAAWRRALDDESRARRYDLDLRVAAPMPVASLLQAITALPQVDRAECWGETAATLALGGDRVVLVQPPVPSALLSLPLLAGRWLRPGERDAIVINQALLARAPSLRAGAPLRLRVGDTERTFRIVGVAKELVPIPLAYAVQWPPLASARGVRVATRRHDAASLRAASRAIERTVPGVISVQSLADTRQALADHLVIINVALLLAASLVVLVGALGLTSAMMLSVVERTRELGILAAIGATPRTIARDVVVQGVVIAALSWVAAVALAVPLTAIVNAVSGRIFIKSALAFVMSPAAAAAWLALVLILGAAATLYPARRASRLTVREALAHE